MKLSEYFKQQQSQEMPAHLRRELFSRIQKEKLIWTEISTKLPSKIFFFASKRIMYASLAAVLVFVVFGWLLLNKTDVIDFWIFSVKENKTPNGVFADYVAEVVQFDWEYSLVRNGKTILSSESLKTIQGWDTVSLSEWTDLIFNLEDWTQAKIVWPAEFSITKSEKWYQISLFDGKFFRIYCPECTSDVEIITPEFSISQEKDQTLDIHIAKEKNGDMLVKNDGDKITVKTKNSENKSESKQVTSGLVSIWPDSEKINIVSDSDMMIAFMTENNISATFTISREKVDWPSIKTNTNDAETVSKTETSNLDKEIVQDNPQPNNIKDIEEDPLLAWIKEIISSDEVVKDVDESVAWDIWLFSDGLQVPSADQMQSLKTNLNGFFLMDVFEWIYKNDKVSQNISKFADRINAVSSAFGYSYRASSDLSSIKSTIQTLKNQLESERYISPSYILQMEKLARWCDELQNPSQSDWESLESDLPINLRLM